MTDAVRFLERLGAQPAFAASPGAYAEELQGLEVDVEQKDALARRDAGALNRLLDGRAVMVCAVCTPDREGEDEEREAPDGDEDVPDRKKDAPDRKKDAPARE